jgi:F0F1-type ATP synthase assembly protein I
MPRQDPDDERSLMMKYAEYSQLAIALPAGTFVGYLIGWLLDKWLGTTFLWLVFLVLGSIGGLIQVIRFVQSRGKS